MANFNNIKHEIDQNVNTNGVQAITGAILNETLKDMIDEVDDKKQDTLVAGSGIAINGNVISATGGHAYTGGTSININENNVIDINPTNIAGTGLTGTYRYGVEPILEVNVPSLAGDGLQTDGDGSLNVNTGNGLQIDGNGAVEINPSVVQEKLTAGANIQINGTTISATDTTYSAGQGLDLNGTTFSVDYDEVQEKLESGQNIKTVNGYSLLGSGDIVIQGGGGGNYLPLEGGTLQNTAPGEDTELKVIDGMDEDYVKIVAPESAGEKPHVEIFENGSGDTKIYYDHIERGSQVSIDLPSSSGTLALTSDLSGKQDTLTAGANIQINGTTISATDTNTTYSAGSGLNLNGTTFSVDTTAIQEKLVAGQNITIQGNTISASGGSGQSYVAGNGIDITGNTISVDNTVATTSDLAGYLPLTGGNLQSNYLTTELRVKSPSDDGYVYLHSTDTASPEIKFHREIQNPTNGEVHEITLRNERLDIERWDQSGNTWMADTLYFPQFKTGTIALTSDLAGKQDTLTAGTGISIQNNVISATGGGGGTTYTAGPGIEIAQNNEIYVKQGSGLGFDQNDNLLVDWSSLPTGNGLTYATDPVDPSISYIQVDTNTIQEKLVAGSNITINGNVISASGGGSGSGLWVNGTGTNSLMAPGTAANPNNTAGGDGALNAASEETLTGHTAYSSAQGDFSVNFGCANSTSADYAGAIGRWNSASGRSSLAIGEGSQASGIGSFAGGRENGGTGSQASGQGDFAFNGTTSGTGGYNTAIDGTVSSGTGYHNISLGGKVGDINKNTSYAVAIGTRSPGYQSEARASYSIALGGLAKGEYSVAIGPAAITNNDYESAIGPFNASYSSSDNAIRTVFTVGNGSYGLGQNTYRNVLEVKKNDDVYVAGIGGFNGSNGNVAGNQSLQTVLNGKQDQLTAGTGISIQGNVISATGGSGASYTAGAGITIDQNNEISANPDGSNIVLDSNDQLNLDFAGVAGNLQGTGLQVDSNTGTTLEVDFSQIPSNIAGNGLQDSGNGTLEIDTTTIVSDLSSSFLPLEGGALQQVDTSYPETDLDVYSPDSASFGYIHSYSEDTTSDPQNPVPAFVEVGLQGQPSGSTDATQGIYLRSNGTIAVDYLDSQGNSEMVELELPRKASGQTYTIATLDDISGGGSYVAGNGINISGSTISVDTGYLDGEYLPLTGGQLKANPSDAETLLDVAAPDSTSAISMSADTIDSKLAISADKTNAGISDGDTFRTVLSNTGEIQVAAKTVNPLDPTDIGETTYTLVLPQKNDTIATLSDIQGGGSSYTAGTGISISAQNVISNSAPDPGVLIPGAGNKSLKLDAISTSADGSYSIALGAQSHADGAYSFAAGQWASASRSNSIALGDNSSSSANYALAVGQFSSASGVGSVAIGQYSEAKNTDEIGLGKYNSSINTGTTAEKTQFTVGNGTGNNARSNLIEAKQNNDIYVIGVGGFDGTNAGASGVETLQDAIANAGGGGTTYTAGNGIDITSGTISVDTTYLDGLYVPITGGSVCDDISQPQTSLDVWSPDQLGYGYIHSISEDSSDPNDVIPASAEIGLQGSLPSNADETYEVYHRNNGTILVGYTTDNQGNTDSAEFAFPQKPSGQTYTIATLDDIQGGSSLWTSGSGTDSLLGPGAIGADGDHSMAAGVDSDAQANESIALGGGVVIYDDSDPNNILNAEYGVAIGLGSTVETASSLAMMGGTASAQNGGSHSVAIGDASTAEGYYDVALTGSTSRGNYSFAASTGIAEGHYSTGLSGGEGNGEGSLASGFGSVAFGYSSAALGLELMTYDQADGTDYTDPNSGEAAFGRYNYSEQNVVFSIGCGHYEPPVDPTDPTDVGTKVRENAITITNDGKIYLKGLGGYTGTSVSGCTDLVSFLNNL